MINQFKYSWEAMEREEKEGNEDEDVYVREDLAAKAMIENEIERSDCGLLHA